MVLAIPISFVVLVKTPSLTNDHRHWRDRQKRALHHRAMVHACWVQTVGDMKIEFPAEVILTRLSPRMLDDDNLRGALKHVRDGIATELGIDDRDPRVRWHYDQEKGQPGVRVTIGEAPKICPMCGRKTEAA